MPAIRPFLFALSTIGSLLFGLLFAASLANPGFVEHVAKDVIRHQVEKKVGEKVDAIDARFLTSKAAVLVKGYEDEIARNKRQLKERLPEKLAAVIAEMRNLDCECRKKVEKDIRSGMEWQIADASQAQARLNGLIRSQYMETSEKLSREFRIFTGTNALVFLLLGVAARVKRGAGLLLLPAAFVLVLATALSSYLYLFNQDWLHTIVFSDYAGFAFVGYVAAVFAFLSDIVFNRARITARLLKWLLDAIGSSLQIAPC